jgi:hypothetical protein
MLNGRMVLHNPVNILFQEEEPYSSILQSVSSLKHSPTSTKDEASLLFSQDSATGPYPKRAESKM